MLVSACAQQLSDTEAFPGFAFGTGENQYLDYPDDPGRVAYIGTRPEVPIKVQVVEAEDGGRDAPVPALPPQPEPLGQNVLDADLGDRDRAKLMGSQAQAWRVGVFLASYRSTDRAEAGWDDIAPRLANDLADLRAYILRVDLGSAKGGIYYRLFAVPLDSEQRARALCRLLEQQSQYCRVATAGGHIKW